MKYAIIAFVALSSIASAAEVSPNAPRRIDFTAPLLDEKGQQYQECAKLDPADQTKCAEIIKITLADLTLSALNNVKGDTKAQLAAWKVMQSIANHKDAELSGPETTIAVDALFALRGDIIAKGRAFPLFEVGEAAQMIDPAYMK